MINEFDFAANNIAVISALSTAYSETVAVVNPESGTGWNVQAVASTDLGTVSVSTAVPDVAPAIESLSLNGVNPDGTLGVQYQLVNRGSATISFYADQDGINYDGILLGESDNLAAGNNSGNVSLSSLNGGVWYVYGLISDGVSTPQQIYAGGDLSIVTATTSNSTIGSSDLQIVENSGSGRVGTIH